MEEISLNSTIYFRDYHDGELFEISQIDHNTEEEDIISMTRQVAIELAYKILDIYEGD